MLRRARLGAKKKKKKKGGGNPLRRTREDKNVLFLLHTSFGEKMMWLLWSWSFLWCCCLGPGSSVISHFHVLMALCRFRGFKQKELYLQDCDLSPNFTISRYCVSVVCMVSKTCNLPKGNSLKLNREFQKRKWSCCL